MSSAAEGASAKQGMAAVLDSGIKVLSADDSVAFTLYVRYVLPTDGTVFWVQSPNTFTAKGSFHYSTEQRQEESETEGRHSVVFSSEQPVQQFSNVQPDTLWVGSYAGDVDDFDGPLVFAFSSRGKYYAQSDLYHYSGTAVLPTLSTQLVTSTEAAAALVQVASNSIPLFLAMNGYVPPYDNGISMPVTIYPSFLVPDNLPPPYGVVHVEPSATEALEMAPMFNQVTSQYQLCRDRVRITLYGTDNSAAMMFVAALYQYSYDYGTFGMATSPSLRDEKKTAPELVVVAQKKTIDMEVNYYQAQVRSVAQQQIEKWVNRYLPQPLTAVGFVPPAP